MMLLRASISGKNSIERTLRSYKYHLMMLLRASISGKNIPKLNSNAISDYALTL